MSIKVWYNITLPFSNFNGCTIKVWEWISNFIPHFIIVVFAYACSVHWLVHWNTTGMQLVDPVCTGIPLVDPANICWVHWNTTGKTSLKLPHAGMPLETLWQFSPTLGHQWKNLVESPSHRDAAEETLTIVAYTGTPLEGLQQPHTQAHIVKQSSIRFSLKLQDGRRPSSKWTGVCKFSFYLVFTAPQWIPVLLLKHVSTSTSLWAYFGYEHHHSFVCIWGCYSNEISSTQTTLTIPVVYIKGCMLGSDLT